MFYPILYKDGIFSTVTDEELNFIYDSRTTTFDDSYVDKLSDKYQELGYKVVWPMTEEGILDVGDGVLKHSWNKGFQP